MADLLIKVGTDAPDPAYQDGDIVVAMNERRILCCHAESICHPWKQSPKANGMRPDGVARNLLELTHEFRFERVSRTEIKRVTIATGMEEILGATPNAKGECIDVEEFIRRRMRETAPEGGPRLAMFGAPGAEIWYGGSSDKSTAKVQQVWDMIEGNTPHRRVNFKKAPFGLLDRRHFLPIMVDDFADVEGEALVASEFDETIPDQPVMLQKRVKAVAWRAVAAQLGLTIAAVENRNVEVDGRSVALARTVIVLNKPRKGR